MSKFSLNAARALHPLDLAEDALGQLSGAGDGRIGEMIARGMHYERLGADELELHIAGEWCNCDMMLEWHAPGGRLHLSARFGIEVPQPLRSRAEHVLALLNELTPAGHFAFWPGGRDLIYRNALILCGSPVTAAQCEDLVLLAVEACQRSYLAFQLILWGGRAPEEAVNLSMMPVEGEA